MLTIEHIVKYLDMIENEHPHKMCKEQKQFAKLIRRILDEELDKIIYIDEDKAEKYLSYQKYFPFDLFEWERCLLVLMLCTFYKSNGLPRFDNLFCLIGRGSGKNAFISYLMFCMSTPTHGIPNYDVFVVANSELQAKTSFNDVYGVLVNPQYEKVMKSNFKYNKTEIRNKKTNSTIRYRTSNAKSSDGLRPGAIIFDEVHAYENWDMIDVQKTGLGKVNHPRQFYITTDGHIRDAVIDSLKEKSADILEGKTADNSFLPFICKLDSEEEVHDRSCWFKANPSLYYRPSLLKQIDGEYVDYKANPYANISFLVKRCNIPKSNEKAPITNYENIKATNQVIPYDKLEGLYCTVGLDYATLNDFTSVAICIRYEGKYYIITHTWVCKQSPHLNRIKAPLDQWESMGLLTFVNKAEVDLDDVFSWVQDQLQKYSFVKFGIDNYRLSLVKKALDNIGIDYYDKEEVKLVRPSDIMQCVPVIDSLFNNGNLVVGDNPLVRWAMNNTQLEPKVNNNFVYGKVEHQSRKNDPFMAIVHAIIASFDCLDDYSESISDNLFPW